MGAFPRLQAPDCIGGKVRRRSLSLFILVATIAAMLVSPTAGYADDDHGRGRGRDDDRRGQNDDRRGQNDDRRDREDDRRGNNNVNNVNNVNNGFRTVGICHFTGSERNSVVFIRVPEESVIAHQRHGDIIGVNSAQDCAPQANVAGATAGTINIGDAVCREGDACVFTVWQSRGTGSATVTFMTEDGTATGGPACTTGIDYVSNVGTVTVGAASTTTLSVQTCTDNLSGPDERFRVRLTGTSSGRIGDGVGRGILLETSVATTGANTVLATTDALGQVTLNWGSTGGIEHRVFFATGGSCAFGIDFRSFLSTATSGTLTGLAPGTLFCFQVRRIEIGGTETVLAATATGGTTSGSGTIAINDANCPEGTMCSFTVTQTGGTGPVTLNYSTGSSSAIGGAVCTNPGAVDFIQVTGGTLVVQANSSAIISPPIGICSDGTAELLETFFVVLSPTAGSTAVITRGTATGTIPAN